MQGRHKQKRPFISSDPSKMAASEVERVLWPKWLPVCVFLVSVERCPFTHYFTGQSLSFIIYEKNQRHHKRKCSPWRPISLCDYNWSRYFIYLTFVTHLIKSPIKKHYMSSLFWCHQTHQICNWIDLRNICWHLALFAFIHNKSSKVWLLFFKTETY